MFQCSVCVFGVSFLFVERACPLFCAATQPRPQSSSRKANKRCVQVWLDSPKNPSYGSSGLDIKCLRGCVDRSSESQHWTGAWRGSVRHTTCQHRTLDSRTAEPEEDDTTETQRTKEEGPFARPFAALPLVLGTEI